jgi:hypothetical protein
VQLKYPHASIIPGLFKLNMLLFCYDDASRTWRLLMRKNWAKSALHKNGHAPSFQARLLLSHYVVHARVVSVSTALHTASGVLPLLL